MVEFCCENVGKLVWTEEEGEKALERLKREKVFFWSKMNGYFAMCMHPGFWV